MIDVNAVATAIREAGRQPGARGGRAADHPSRARSALRGGVQIPTAGAEPNDLPGPLLPLSPGVRDTEPTQAAQACVAFLADHEMEISMSDSHPADDQLDITAAIVSAHVSSNSVSAADVPRMMHGDCTARWQRAG